METFSDLFLREFGCQLTKEEEAKMQKVIHASMQDPEVIEVEWEFVDFDNIFPHRMKNENNIKS